MPLNIIRKCGYVIEKTHKVVRAANGTEANVSLRLDNKQFVIKTLVSQDVEEIMLGYDFLTTNKCIWDFGANQITIQGKLCIPFAKHGQTKMSKTVRNI